MSDEVLKRDQNFVTVLAGITDDSDQDIMMLRVDPISKRLLVKASGIAAGVTSLNGLTGAVTLAAGNDISLTTVGNTITIDFTGSSGVVTSVSNSDGTLTISPTTGAVVASLALSHANIWSGLQTFGNNISFGGATLNVTSLATNNLLQYNGTNWVNVAPSSLGFVTSVSGTANRITSTGGTTPVIDISVAYVGQTSITTLGTIGAGTWQGTKIGLAYGGTNADLSATGGTSNYLKQSSVGAAITVGTIPASDITSGAALTKVDDTNVTLTLGGTPSTALLAATSLTLGWTGTLAVSRGGTGTGTTFTQGSVIFAGASGVYSQDNANFFWDATNHRLGIGTVSPAAFLHVLGTTQQLRLGYDSTHYTTYTVDSGGSLTVSPTGTNAGSTFYSNGTGTFTFNSAVTTGNEAGGNAAVNINANALTSGSSLALGSTSITTGKLLEINPGSGVNAWTGNGTSGGLVDILSTSTGGTASSSSILLRLTRSGANSNASHIAYGSYSAVTNTGTTSTNIAGYFSASGATNNYGLIVENGSVGIGVTSPTAILHLKAGTTGASTAPLKFNSGSLLTSPEAGAIEFLTDGFYGTVTTGAVRQQFITDVNTVTLTNKTLIATSNVVEEITTTASSATPTPTGGSLRNFFTVTALAAGATFAAPSGSPANGNYLTIRILDNGTARSLAWNAIYRAGTSIALPTTTTLSKTLYVGFRYNSASSTWDLLSYADGF